jgi:translocation and assembly module TamB
VNAPVVVPQPRKRLFRILRWSIALLLLAAIASVIFYLNSDAFRAALRGRIVAELERATGGKVELKSLDWNLLTLHFEARGLTIQGREAAGEVPYFQAAQITADSKLVSLLSSRLALRKVAIDHPTLHLIFYPDGSTNQPSPHNGASASSDPQRLFDLAVQDLQIASGTLLLDHEPIPFELTGQKFTAALIYSQQERGYEGTIALSLLSARWRGIPQERSQVELQVLLRQTAAGIKSLKIAAEPGTLEAHGTLRNYRSPELSLEYQASLNVPALARIARMPQLTKGEAEVKGELDYHGRRYSSQGSVNFREVEWKDETVRVSQVEGASAFSVTPERASLSRITARVLGGSLQGEAQIAPWNEQSKGSVTLRILGLQLRNAAEAVSLPGLPLHKLGLAGSISGDARISWTGKVSGANAEFQLETSPPPTPSLRLCARRIAAIRRRSMSPPSSPALGQFV